MSHQGLQLLNPLLAGLYGSYGGSYLLDDEFSDTLAAGAGNGTPAVPGPGVRVDADTNSKMTQAAGLLSFATGGAGAGDPGRWWDLQVRAAGRLLVAEVTPAGATDASVGVGWDSATAGAILDSLNFAASGAIRFMANDATAVTVGTYVAGTSYQIRIVMRAAGMRLYIKGGTYTNWTLLCVSAAGTGNGYPAIGALGTAAIATSDYVRSPAQLWIGGAPLASDSFNRGNGSLNASVTDGAAVEEAGGAGKVWTATTWTIAGNVAKNTPTLEADVIVNGAFAADTDWTHDASWTLAGVNAAAAAAVTDLTQTVAPLTANVWYQVTWTNGVGFAGYIEPVCGTVVGSSSTGAGAKKAILVANGTAFVMRPGSGAVTGTIDDVVCQPLTLASLFATIPVGIADVIVELPITSTSMTTPVGIVVNLDSAASPANFSIAYYSMRGSRVYLDEYVAGVRTQKIAATVTYVAGASLVIVRSGTSCEVYYNSIQVGTTQTMTANTAANHGMFSTQATPTVNNLAIWARGVNSEYSALDAF